MKGEGGGERGEERKVKRAERETGRVQQIERDRRDKRLVKEFTFMHTYFQSLDNLARTLSKTSPSESFA